MPGANAAPRPALQVIADGQSNCLSVYGGDYAWPTTVRLSGTFGARHDVVAASGNSWTALLASIDDATRLGPLAGRISAGGKSIACHVGGTADIGVENNTGATAYADWGSYITAAKARGITHVIGCTLTKAEAWNSTQRGRCDDLNTLLLADASGHFDGMVDLTVTSLETYGSSSNPTDYADGVHWNATGHDKVAALFETAIDAIVNP